MTTIKDKAKLAKLASDAHLRGAVPMWAACVDGEIITVWKTRVLARHLGKARRVLVIPC